MSLYSNDWHQCHRCGCTFQDETLRALSLVDNVLKLTSDIYECRDIARCDVFRQHRQDALARERVGAPIGQHSQSRRRKTR